ncbi:MAG: helix-turn-helix domain-containing protein [Candidatus Avilachnospira sp.]
MIIKLKHSDEPGAFLQMYGGAGGRQCLKHNLDVSAKTLNDLCRILDCRIEDVVKYVPSDKDQPL